VSSLESPELTPPQPKVGPDIDERAIVLVSSPRLGPRLVLGIDNVARRVGFEEDRRAGALDSPPVPPFVQERSFAVGARAGWKRDPARIGRVPIGVLVDSNRAQGEGGIIMMRR